MVWLLSGGHLFWPFIDGVVVGLLIFLVVVLVLLRL